MQTSYNLPRILWQFVNNHHTVYFHHQLTLCRLGDTRESWGLGNKRQRERKKAPQELDPVRSFITFEEKGGKAHSFVSEQGEIVLLFICTFFLLWQETWRIDTHSQRHPSSKALTHASTMKYEDAAISYLCLEMNWLDQADVSTQLQGLTEGNAFALFGAGCCLATSLYLTASTKVKMFPRGANIHPPTPQPCCLFVPIIIFTWLPRVALTPLSEAHFNCKYMYWTHHADSLSLD